jgi:outer membrane lipoprotein-sorting protein
MDAIALLNQVSDAYSRISTLSIEATVINESGDEDENQRSEHRVRFLYAAPDRVPYEPLGSRGVLTVCDGTQIHTLFRHRGPMKGPHYSGVPASSRPLPHSFRPDLPSGGNNDAFLFTRVNEQVKEAEMLPDEDGHRVVSVTYEPGPISMISTSPIRFWIDPDSFRIMRTEVTIGHRLPAQDEIDWTRHTVVVRQVRVDEPIPDKAFNFTVPAGAVEMPRGRGNDGQWWWRRIQSTRR